MLAKVAVVFALAMPGVVFADDAAETPIHDIVTAGTSCSIPAGGAIASTPYAGHDAVLKTGMLAIDGTDYRVDFNAIPDMREYTVAVNLHATDRGVDDSYVLFTRDGLVPYTAAYLITKLPDDLKDEGNAMEATMALQEGNAGDHKLSFGSANTPLGPGMEMIADGRVGSPCFPTSPFQFMQQAETASVGISRFVVRNGTVIEYALVLSLPADIEQPEVAVRARAAMDAFQRGLVLHPAE